ncbi:MAG: phosphoglycerate dehydrogenase [Spirochaetaceae bacterium]|jgi:D-3-phosphoglycerate dehydrogenase|nr:phosphoglycerate dehydrogenase [Spirochaetaceae bacterium]
MEKKYRIQTMNQISPQGLALFPKERYEIGETLTNPDAILLRSADLHGPIIPDSAQAVARAGAGYNNIPVDKCSDRGIVVFNTPGGNANAVKELALAGLLIGSRDIMGSIAWTGSIAGEPFLADLLEQAKSRFEGPEIRGKVLGVVGLGAIGVMVANDALALGMEVMGYDPYISVEAAWNLSRSVVRADSLEGLLAKADYVSLHLPLSDATKGIINGEKIGMMKTGARIINFARGGLADESALIEALGSGKLARYVTDFPTPGLLACPKAVCIPHLGASTPEAEDNCAVMAARQIMDFLETGTIKNSVNFPKCSLERRSPFRLLVANRNIPNMLGQITTILAGLNVNIVSSINQSRDQYAYNIIDTEQALPESGLDQIKRVPGIIRVRALS